jgi:hypothetical protein
VFQRNAVKFILGARLIVDLPAFLPYAIIVHVSIHHLFLRHPAILSTALEFMIVRVEWFFFFALFTTGKLFLLL